MNAAIADIRLTGGWLPVIVDLAAIVLTVLLVGLLALPVRRAGGLSARRRLRRTAFAAVGSLLGAAIGLLLCWLLSDQLNLFDVSLTPMSRAWVAGAFAVVGAASVALVGVGVPRRGVAVAAAVMALAAATLGVNADFGQYTTIGSLTGASVAPHFPTQVLAEQRSGAPGATAPTADGAHSLWRNAVAIGMPARGLVGAVNIPSTVSHFAARAAYVYLPPAALAPNPVPLPVIIMLSGQPGSPSNVISSGQIASVLDAFAAAHDGLAPIVVVPDQLGAPVRNPMCVDSSLGASASYLTVDVPAWIRTHLTVESSPEAWGIGGFSQGGTCAIQLGAAHPELFSAIIDISGQLAPKNGGLAQTIALGFGGDAAAYHSALPETLLARNAPYRNMVAVFGVGQLDTRYGPIAAQVRAASEAAGIRSTLATSPGTGHDWHTVKWVLENALQPVYAQLGLVRAS